MAAMALFPMYFLKSFAYAGVATVTFVAAAAIVVTPAAIALLAVTAISTVLTMELIARGRLSLADEKSRT